jgi:hypothetical protein
LRPAIIPPWSTIALASPSIILRSAVITAIVLRPTICSLLSRWTLQGR